MVYRIISKSWEVIWVEMLHNCQESFIEMGTQLISSNMKSTLFIYALGLGDVNCQGLFLAVVCPKYLERKWFIHKMTNAEGHVCGAELLTSLHLFILRYR